MEEEPLCALFFVLMLPFEQKATSYGLLLPSSDPYSLISLGF